MRRVLRDNGLSVTMFAIFLVFPVAQSVAGYVTTTASVRSIDNRRSPTAST
jgi:hypothetical protein